MELLSAFLGEFTNAVGVVGQQGHHQLLKGGHEGLI